MTSERERFAVQALQAGQKLASLCREFGISRPTGYKWRERYAAQGRAGLADRSSRPAQAAAGQARRWAKRAMAVRAAHPSWGGKKIRAQLAEESGKRGVPSARSIERWLKKAGLLKVRRRHIRRGPGVPHPGLTIPRRRHQVWTIDFKGWYRTGDGQRQQPLTVRELRWRYLVAIVLLPDQSDAGVRKVLARVFREHGLPRAIRVDNGAPFGGSGALGLTRLSVWWLRLGIRVEFTRRARPGDNAGHEQMHAVYAEEVAAEPALDRREEQRRVDRWRQEYNEERPHEALGQRRPGANYRRSERAYPEALAELEYPAGWAVRRVRAYGNIKWEGRMRFIGRAFVGEKVGLKDRGRGVWAVHLGEVQIGELHRADPTSMRPAHWRRVPEPTKTKV